METVQKVVLGVHTLIAILIIVLVLLQRGKGADAGAAFGAGASGTVFGARGSASFFSRMTAIFATAFFVSSLTLAYLSSQHVGGEPTSLMDEAAGTDGAAGDAPAADEPNAGGELPSLDDGQGDSSGEAAESGDAPAADDVLPELPAEEETTDE